MISGSRVGLVLAVWLYALALHVAHVEYLNPAWEYYGFTYQAPGLLEVSLMAIFVTTIAMILPLQMLNASSTILLLLFIVVYVPTIIITLGLAVDSVEHYGLNLSMLCLIFAIACIATRSAKKQEIIPQLPSNTLGKVFLWVWLCLSVVLVYIYAPIMKMAGLDEIYEQRAIGASENILVGYIQTYFSNVLSPALIALGLIRRKYWFILIGVIGCVIIYMITAQRTVFLLPFAMIGFYCFLTSKISFLQTNSFLILILSVVVMFCSLFYLDNNVASFLSTYLVFRTLALPGLTFSQYSDVFSTHGFTLWSHVKGFNIIIASPGFFENHASWPGLGYIVGDIVYNNTENNVNANLFSSDGIAAAGSVGVLAIGVIFTVWLIFFNHVTRTWNQMFVILVTLPLAISLTNGPFFTMLWSFGGIFWLIIFHICKSIVKKAEKNSCQIKPSNRET